MSLRDPVLVTGATGFIGGFLTAELLKRGAGVIALVRPSGETSPLQRMRDLLRFFHMEFPGNLEVVEGSVDIPGLGLEKGAASRVNSSAATVLHCAASTSFAARKSGQVEKVNVDGTANVLRAAGSSSRFCHMSTAYSAGIRSDVCREELTVQENFNNRYEESKHRAELEVTELCRREGKELTIFRPTIVCGDSVTGRSLCFTGLYYPVRMLLFLADSMRKDIVEKDGARAGKLGVSMDGSGRVNLPVDFPGDGHINILPVDYLVAAVLRIMETGRPGIYHIVNPAPSTVGRVAEFIQACYPVSGIRVDGGGGTGPLQRLLDSYMELYYPYFCDGRVFDDARAAAILQPAGIECPPLDVELFRRCMDYAVETGWNPRPG